LVIEMVLPVQGEACHNRRNNTVNARSRPPYAAILLLGLCAITVYSYLRGQNDTPEWAGKIYYVIDYSDGLIRRGLIGQLFMLVYTRAQTAQIWAMALAMHRAVCFAVMGGILVWFWSVIWTNRRFAPGRLALIYLLFAAAQFYPTLAATNTYLDAYVFALVVAAFAAAAYGRLVLAFACGFIAPFIHDISVVLWLSLIIVMVWRAFLPGTPRPVSGRIAACLVCMAPFIGQAVVASFESHAALMHQLAIAPLPPAILDLMRREQLGHSILGDFAVMRGMYAANPARAIISIIAFSLPSAGMIALARPALDRRAMAALALAALAPLAVLILEFDLSRFTVSTQFTAMLAILFIAATPPAASAATPISTTRREKLFALPAVALLLLMPLVYGYFDTTLIRHNEVLDRTPVLGPALQEIYHLF